ncbi:MAG: hypothetical protein PHH77_10605 [Victivallaceae bacterium]|nr:hypothetical protein [Victivallaceae bacterium]
MSEETTTQTTNPTQTTQTPNPPPETDFENLEITPWPSQNDSLTDAAIGFGLGALATIAIVSIASIFKR